MTPEQVEAYVRQLGREELGIEPSDAEIARGCAVLAALAINGMSPGYLRLRQTPQTLPPKPAPVPVDAQKVGS